MSNGSFRPSRSPELLVEAIRSIVNGRNVVASEDYEYDLLIFIDCWVQCQNEDFKSFLNAPEDAKPPSRIVTSRRATSVIYDLFGDPPASRGESIALFALRPPPGGCMTGIRQGQDLYSVRSSYPFKRLLTFSGQC